MPARKNVILSAASRPLANALAESKDPYKLAAVGREDFELNRQRPVPLIGPSLRSCFAKRSSHSG